VLIVSDVNSPVGRSSYWEEHVGILPSTPFGMTGKEGVSRRGAPEGVGGHTARTVVGGRLRPRLPAACPGSAVTFSQSGGGGVRGSKVEKKKIIKGEATFGSIGQSPGRVQKEGIFNLGDHVEHLGVPEKNRAGVIPRSAAHAFLRRKAPSN